MAEKFRKPYIESSVFISLINDEISGDVERGKIAACLLSHAEAGNFPVYTSTMTIVEVHKKRGEGYTTLDSQRSELILQFFEHDYIKIIDVDRRISEEAHRYCQKYGLMPVDAVHLASAIRGGCDIFLTWDKSLLAKASQIEDVPIIIAEPTEDDGVEKL